MIDKKEQRIIPGSAPKHDENQNRQQVQSQSPAPQTALRGEEGNGDKPASGQPVERISPVPLLRHRYVCALPGRSIGPAIRRAIDGGNLNLTGANRRTG